MSVRTPSSIDLKGAWVVSGGAIHWSTDAPPNRPAEGSPVSIPLKPGVWLLKSEKLIPWQTTTSFCTAVRGWRMPPEGNVKDVPEPVGQYWLGTVPFGENMMRRCF